MRIRSPVPEKKTRIEIIPLIDIMFFLLASFMMVSLQMQKVQTVRASLPTATLPNPNQPKPEMINLSVDARGGVAVDKQEMNLAELERFLTNKVALQTNIPVYITGHKDTPHGSMVFVLDFVKRAGVQKVAFAVKATDTGPRRP